MYNDRNDINNVWCKRWVTVTSGSTWIHVCVAKRATGTRGWERVWTERAICGQLYQILGWSGTCLVTSLYIDCISVCVCVWGGGSAIFYWLSQFVRNSFPWRLKLYSGSIIRIRLHVSAGGGADQLTQLCHFLSQRLRQCDRLTVTANTHKDWWICKRLK